jgi:hypothetical protein
VSKVSKTGAVPLPETEKECFEVEEQIEREQRCWRAEKEKERWLPKKIATATVTVILDTVRAITIANNIMLGIGREVARRIDEEDARKRNERKLRLEEVWISRKAAIYSVNFLMSRVESELKGYSQRHSIHYGGQGGCDGLGGGLAGEDVHKDQSEGSHGGYNSFGRGEAGCGTAQP